MGASRHRNRRRSPPGAHAGAGLQRRPSVSARFFDAFGLASGGRDRTHGDRLFKLRRARLQLQISLGTHHRPARRSVSFALRPPPGLDATLSAKRRPRPDWDRLRQSLALAGLDRGLCVLCRLFVGNARRGGGWLAHRRGARRAPGHDVGELSARLPDRPSLRGSWRPLYRRFRWLEGGLYHHGHAHGRRHHGKHAGAASAANGAGRTARILPQALCRAGRRSHSAQRRDDRPNSRARCDLSRSRLRLRRDGEPALHRSRFFQNRHRNGDQTLRRLDRHRRRFCWRRGRTAARADARAPDRRDSGLGLAPDLRLARACWSSPGSIS